MQDTDLPRGIYGMRLSDSLGATCEVDENAESAAAATATDAAETDGAATSTTTAEPATGMERDIRALRARLFGSADLPEQPEHTENDAEHTNDADRKEKEQLDGAAAASQSLPFPSATCTRTLFSFCLSLRHLLSLLFNFNISNILNSDCRAIIYSSQLI